MSPGALPRRGTQAAEPAQAAAHSTSLGYHLPYDLGALLGFIALRAIPGVEAVDGHTLRRSVRAGLFGSDAGWVEATFEPAAARLHLRCAAPLPLEQIVPAVRRWLDLDLLPQPVDAALADLPGAPGTRLPGGLDAFELAVRAVLGQQISVVRARALAQRLVERHGDAVETPWRDIGRTFPAPQALAALPLERIAELGIIRMRASAILALARAWPELATLLAPGAAPAPLIARLCALPGIGPWTAHYIAMRVLGWADALPPNDVAVLNAMRRHCGNTSAREAEQRAQAWQPWRSYAVLRLWHSVADRR